MSIDKDYLSVLKSNIDDPEVIKSLSAFSRRMYATRTLGHWDLFKEVFRLPGDIVELGVYRGETLLNFARFLEILCPGDREKRVLGFDHWSGLSNFTSKDGHSESVKNIEGGWNPELFKPTLDILVRLFSEDSFVPAKPRIKLIDGDIRFTAKKYVEENPGLKISLLHFDCDMYEPTLEGLKAFYPRVVSGGLVLFDEYGCADWPGETAAVDEYFEGRPPVMQKFPWQSTPGGWFFKE